MPFLSDREKLTNLFIDYKRHRIVEAGKGSNCLAVGDHAQDSSFPSKFSKCDRNCKLESAREGRRKKTTKREENFATDFQITKTQLQISQVQLFALRRLKT